LTNVDRFIRMVLPINIGQFNDFLEDHIRYGLVPTVYTGSLNPLDNDFGSYYIITHYLIKTIPLQPLFIRKVRASV